MKLRIKQPSAFDQALTAVSQIANSRWNPIAQTQAVMGMDPNQAAEYRQTVDKTVPRVPLNNIPGFKNLTEGVAAAMPYISAAPKGVVSPETVSHVADRIVNAIPNAVAGGAKLPAARTIQQGAGDILDFGTGALQGAGLLHGTLGAINTIKEHPDMILNQRGGYDPNYDYNVSVDSMTSKPMAGNVNLSSGVDKLKVIGDKPEEVQLKQLFDSPEVQHAIQTSPDNMRDLLTRAAAKGDYRAVMTLLGSQLPPEITQIFRSLVPVVDQANGAILPK